MIRIPKNATCDTEAKFVDGNKSWRLYMYKCNEGSYAVIGELKVHHEFYSFYAESGEDPEEDDIYIDLGIWDAGKNEKKAIKFFFKKVKEFEALLNQPFDINL